MNLTIGKLARMANVNVETIRYYQRRGLLRVPERSSGFRKYGGQDLERIRFIQETRDLGFALSEVQEFLALEPGRTDAVSRKLTEVDKKIRSLNGIRSALNRIADETSEVATNATFLDVLPAEDQSVSIRTA